MKTSRSDAAAAWAICGKRWDVEREQILTFTVPVMFKERNEAVRELAIINTIPTAWNWEIISTNDRLQ